MSVKGLLQCSQGILDVIQSRCVCSIVRVVFADTGPADERIMARPFISRLPVAEDADMHTFLNGYAWDSQEQEFAPELGCRPWSHLSPDLHAC
jgi:hypothetical protein